MYAPLSMLYAQDSHLDLRFVYFWIWYDRLINEEKLEKEEEEKNRHDAHIQGHHLLSLANPITVWIVKRKKRFPMQNSVIFVALFTCKRLNVISLRTC